FTGLILQGLAGPLTDEQSKQLGMVNKSAKHLLSLINDVLDISKIESGQLDIERASFNVRESVQRVAVLVSPLAEKKGLRVTANVAPEIQTIVGDQRRFEQVAINLLNNAIKFTERGEVELAADA